MKKNIKYCKEYLYPNTKTNLFFDNNGVCSACNNYKNRNIIDWPKRKKQFETLVNNIKKNKNNYDCLIPVSGGKDSTFQFIILQKKRLKKLKVI